MFNFFGKKTKDLPDLHAFAGSHTTYVGPGGTGVLTAAFLDRAIGAMEQRCFSPISHAQGCLRVGQRVRSNGDSLHKEYTGTIVEVSTTRFCVRRDDGYSGGGVDRSWQVFWTNAGFVEIIG